MVVDKSSKLIIGTTTVVIIGMLATWGFNKATWKYKFNRFIHHIMNAQSKTPSHLTPIPNVTKLRPNVTRILGQNPGKFTLQGTNTYLVGQNETRILIDTGDGKTPYLPLLNSVLDEEGGVEISDVIITHWHHDHVGGIPQIRSIFPNVRIWKHQLPQPESPQEELDPTGHPYLYLSDGKAFDIDSLGSLRVIHCPGHTKDHCALLLSTDDHTDVLFTGDCVLGEGSAVFESLHEYMTSLNVLIEQIKSKNAEIFPAHGPTIENGLEKIEDYIKHRNHRESQIVDQLSDGIAKNPMELVEIIYAEMNLGWKLKQGAKNSVTQHLKKLEVEGKVSEDDGKWKLINSRI